MAARSSGTTLCTTPAASAATCGPPSASLVTSSPVADFTSGGPAAKSEADSVMTTKSDNGAVNAPWPADAPSTRHTSGTTPESSARPSRSPGRRPAAESVTRWPAPSSSITSGTRSCKASWHRRKRLSDAPVPMEPPSTVTSSAPATAGRPPMRPDPATSASPGTAGSSAVPTNWPISENEPGSKRAAMRSRACRRPRSRCRTRRASPPMASASTFRRSISCKAGTQSCPSSLIAPLRSARPAASGGPPSLHRPRRSPARK